MPEKYLALSESDRRIAEIIAHESSMSIDEHMELNGLCGTHNYKPLHNVFSYGRGVWLWNIKSDKYMDFLSCYSACNAGHCNPIIRRAAKRQIDRLDSISGAFINDQEGLFLAELTRFCGKDKALVKNAGVESVETAVKAARRYGYEVLKIPEGMAQIIVAAGNFHGRTNLALAMSTEKAYKRGFGPYPPEWSFPSAKFGDIDAMRALVNENTCAIIIEPIQGEAGVIIPPPGYLKAVRDLCTEKGILMIADEIQVGLGRTGKRFACDWENVIPDGYIVGKALGGNLLPVSAFVANNDIMGTFTTGSDGSTFRLNPLACAAGRSYLQCFAELKLAERSEEMGDYFMKQLRTIQSEHINEIRGRGLLIGTELYIPARPYCEALMEERLLCKETHDKVIRFAPPLVITKKEIDWAFKRIKKVLES